MRVISQRALLEAGFYPLLDSMQRIFYTSDCRMNSVVLIKLVSAILYIYLCIYFVICSSQFNIKLSYSSFNWVWQQGWHWTLTAAAQTYTQYNNTVTTRLNASTTCILHAWLFCHSLYFGLLSFRQSMFILRVCSWNKLTWLIGWLIDSLDCAQFSTINYIRSPLYAKLHAICSVDLRRLIINFSMVHCRGIYCVWLLLSVCLSHGHISKTKQNIDH